MTRHCLKIKAKLLSTPHRAFYDPRLQLYLTDDSHSRNTPNKLNHSFWSFLNGQCSRSPLLLVHIYMCYSLCLEFVLSLPPIICSPGLRLEITFHKKSALKAFSEFCVPPECSTELFFYAYHALLTACLIFASPPRLWHPWKKKQCLYSFLFSFINQNEGFLYSSE